MKRIKGLLTLISLALLMMIPLAMSSASAGRIQVITSQTTPVETIDDGTIKKVFLGKTKSWPDGNGVEFVVLKSGDIHDEFLKAYVKKSRSLPVRERTPNHLIQKASWWLIFPASQGRSDMYLPALILPEQKY